MMVIIESSGDNFWRFRRKLQIQLCYLFPKHSVFWPDVLHVTCDPNTGYILNAFPVLFFLLLVHVLVHVIHQM